MTIDEMIEVLQAYKDGAQIQVRNICGVWVDLQRPKWDFDGPIYRVKPQTITINGIEVIDDFIRDEGFRGRVWVENSLDDEFHEWWNIGSDSIEQLKLLIQRGIAHKTKEGAIQAAKARLGVKE